MSHKQHKWFKEIIAWANGSEIQSKGKFSEHWFNCSNPVWNDSFTEFRIKP